MRVTYLTGQAPASVDLGPVIVPGGVGGLPVGVEGQFLGYGPGGVPAAVAAPSGEGSYDDAPLVARVVLLEQEPAPTWAEVTGKPTAFVPTTHGHSISDVTGLRAELDAIPAAYDDAALSGRVTALEDAPAPSWGDVTGKPTAFTPAAHGHSIGDVSGLTTALDGKAATSHSHAWAEITGKPTTFPPSAHTHAWDEITSKPTTFAPSAHGHTVADVNGLQTALDGKQPTTTFKTVNSQAVTGSGNIVTALSFATDAEALAYSNANPGVVVFSRQVT